MTWYSSTAGLGILCVLGCMLCVYNLRSQKRRRNEYSFQHLDKSRDMIFHDPSSSSDDGLRVQFNGSNGTASLRNKVKSK